MVNILRSGELSPMLETSPHEICRLVDMVDVLRDPVDEPPPPWLRSVEPSECLRTAAAAVACTTDTTPHATFVIFVYRLK